MIIQNTNSIRNDYYYNFSQVNDLENSISEVQNELDLLKINVQENDISIRQDLNNLESNIANQINTDNVNANNATIDFAKVNGLKVDNLSSNNATLENVVFNRTVNNLIQENSRFINGSIENSTIKNVVIGSYVCGLSGTFLSFIVLGNFGLVQHGCLLYIQKALKQIIQN